MSHLKFSLFVSNASINEPFRDQIIHFQEFIGKCSTINSNKGASLLSLFMNRPSKNLFAYTTFTCNQNRYLCRCDLINNITQICDFELWNTRSSSNLYRFLSFRFNNLFSSRSLLLSKAFSTVIKSFSGVKSF